MVAALLVNPTDPQCTTGVIYFDVDAVLGMCGHGTIGTVTMALEEGLVTPKEPGVLYLDAPAGRIKAEYTMKDGYVEEVRITLARPNSRLNSIKSLFQ